MFDSVQTLCSAATTVASGCWRALHEWMARVGDNT